MCERERGPACVTTTVPWWDRSRRRQAGSGRAPLQRRARFGCETRGVASTPADRGMPPIPVIPLDPSESHSIPLVPLNPTCPTQSHLSHSIPLVPPIPLNPGESHSIPLIPLNPGESRPNSSSRSHGMSERNPDGERCPDTRIPGSSPGRSGHVRASSGMTM